MIQRKRYFVAPYEDAEADTPTSRKGFDTEKAARIAAQAYAHHHPYAVVAIETAERLVDMVHGIFAFAPAPAREAFESGMAAADAAQAIAQRPLPLRSS